MECHSVFVKHFQLSTTRAIRGDGRPGCGWVRHRGYRSLMEHLSFAGDDRQSQ